MAVRDGASERALRSLVPAEQWPHPNAFWVDTHLGKWVVDLDNPTAIYMVVSKEIERPGCDCDACMGDHNRQTARYHISTDEYWLRPRGVYLDTRAAVRRRFIWDLATWEAKVARALTIALLLMTEPETVDCLCCG